MARSEPDAVKLIDAVYRAHKRMWQDRMPTLRLYKEAYESRFWGSRKLDGTVLRVETADAANHVDGLQATLFSRAPAVEVGEDLSGDGNKELAQGVANRWLQGQRQPIENASRLALLYPQAFLKLGPRASTSQLDSIDCRPVEPWNVILDLDASTWESQRFVGHIYWLPVPDAKERFGGKKYTPVAQQRYFEQTDGKMGRQKQDELPEDMLYVEVVELYDLLSDALYFWSPNYSNGKKLLDREDEIPVRGHDDTPLVPIVPLYYSRVPDCPLDGISSLSRIYDQIHEKNVLRTFWAGAIRKDTRQWLARAGVLDDEALALLTAGVDGAVIPVDAESLDGALVPVPVQTLGANHREYLDAIEADLDRGSTFASFTRGEASNVTATEVAVLAQYSASGVGRLARERDEAIERLAQIYVAMLRVNLDKPETIVVDGRAKIVKPDDLKGKFRFVAVDQGSTPISKGLKRQQLTELIPVLTKLGVSGRKILEELVRQYDLPEDFLAADEAPGGGRIGRPSVTPESGAAGPAQLPASVANALPEGTAPTAALQATLPPGEV